MNTISPKCSCSFYDINSKERAIYAVQTMLSAISRYDSSVPLIVPDGIYSAETANAVRQFCITRGLEVRDTVDNTVFYAIAGEYRAILNNHSGNPIRVDVFPEVLKKGTLQMGDAQTDITIIQSMFADMADICEEYSAVEINGVYDEKTENALSRVRAVYKVGSEELIDIETWNAVAREYNDRKLRIIE